jgi:hypothetical protein
MGDLKHQGQAEQNQTILMDTDVWYQLEPDVVAHAPYV